MEEINDEEPEPAVSEGEEDFPHNLESEGFVPVDGSATGTLDSATDRDFFRVKLVSGAEYEFTVTGRDGVATNTLEDPFLVLRDADNVYLDQDDDSGGESDPRIIYLPSVSGDFWLDVRSFGANPTGAYTVSATQLAKPGQAVAEVTDIPGNTNSTASLAVGQSFVGEIENVSDTDWFSFNHAGSDTIYALEVDTVGLGDEALTDPVLVVRSEKGPMLGIRDDNAGGRNPRLIFDPLFDFDSDYWLEVKGFSGVTGRYRATFRELDHATNAPATDFTGIEIPPSVATSTFVPLAGFVKGTLETDGDKDAYKIALTEGYSYRLELKGLDGEDELIDPHLVLRDEQGTYLDQRDGSDRQGASLDYTPNATGIYIAQVASYGNEPIGEYVLSLNLVAATNDDVEGTPYTIATLDSENTSIIGSIDFVGDHDFYKVRLEDGQKYDISVEIEHPYPWDSPILLQVYGYSPGGGELIRRFSGLYSYEDGEPNGRYGVEVETSHNDYIVAIGGIIGFPTGYNLRAGPYKLTVSRR